MVKISNSSYENKIHRVDSPSNGDSKNIYFFARESLEKLAKNREIYC